MTEQELLALWDQFAEVPYNDYGEIKKPFHIWPEGTPKIQIWNWFDDQFPRGIVAAVFGELL